VRVVGGKYKGRRFRPPKKFPSRPTTDYAKEALFNILENRYDLEQFSVLDLFAGTGNISMEFLSRIVKNVLSVDNHRVAVEFMLKTQDELKDENWQIIRRDAFRFCQRADEKFELIFADPPYGITKLNELIDTIFDKNLLQNGGLLVIEHGQESQFENRTHFRELRKYGGVNFSFFGET